MRIASTLVGGLHALSLGIISGHVAVVDGNPLPQQGANAEPSAALRQGNVKGFKDSYGNSVFLGIPFAATTGGENRYDS